LEKIDVDIVTKFF